MANDKIITAAIMVIGNEILSGRTKDSNIGWLAEYLSGLHIQVREVRVVPDITADIVAAVNALRARYDYVFTTGGIGPTHDDITADAIAAAFGVGIDHHLDAVALLENYYPAGELNDARRRMARIPDGGVLIENPVSAAPGFQLGNVFVLAGVPRIMQAMAKTLANRLVGGAPVHSITVQSTRREGDIAEALAAIQAAYPSLDIGSYPFFKDGQLGVALVLRGTDMAALQQAEAAVQAMVDG